MANELKTDKTYFNSDDFIQINDSVDGAYMEEITVTITLSEYRSLVVSSAKGTNDKFYLGREIERLKMMLRENGVDPDSGRYVGINHAEVKADA